MRAPASSSSAAEKLWSKAALVEQKEELASRVEQTAHVPEVYRGQQLTAELNKASEHRREELRLESAVVERTREVPWKVEETASTAAGFWKQTVGSWSGGGTS